MTFTAEMIAAALNGRVEGDPAAAVHTVSSIEDAGPGALAYLTSPKYEKFLYASAASIVLVNDDFQPSAPVATTLVRVPDAGVAVRQLLEMYEAARPRKKGVSPNASISEKATLGENCYVGDFAVIEAGARIGDRCRIYPHTYVGDGVVIGEDTVLHPHATIYEGCRVGARCTLHAGSVVGADGFGFALRPDGGFDKIPQLGNVIIEDDVEIGANTCVDRAKTDSTILRSGVKLDNLIQIGHNVQVGSHTVMSAQSGVAGSTKIGRNCFFGGQVGIVDHITVGDRVKVAAKSGLEKSTEDDATRMGFPSMPGFRFHRVDLIFRHLPELEQRVRALEKKCLPTE